MFIFLTLVSSTEEGHICRPPCLLEREEKNIIFLLGEWVRLEVMERTGSSGRFEGEKSGKDEKRERNG